MIVDFEKLQTDVSDIKAMLQRFTGRQDPQPATTATLDEVLDYKQAANLLGLSIQTLYGKVSRREIPFTRIKKRTYFSKQDLLAWLRSQRTATIDEQATQHEQSRLTRREQNRKALDKRTVQAL